MPGTITGPEAVKRSLILIDHVRSLAEKHPNEIVLATTAAEVRAAHKAGKFAALMGMEGGHMIDDSLAVLRDYQRLGVRYLTLSHSVNTNWSDSSGDTPKHNGLTDFGKDVVRELNRLGMLVDISHVSDKTFWDALETSKAPLVASHSSLRSISGHPRNMTDDMIRALGGKGGVIMINYSRSFLSDELYQAGLKNVPPAQRPTVSWEKIVEHIDHAVKLVGATHVGLGSDFDGTTVPDGMDDVSMLPKITAALLDKGYSEQDVKNILGENILRLLEKVDAVGKEIRAGSSAGRAGLGRAVQALHACATCSADASSRSAPTARPMTGITDRREILTSAKSLKNGSALISLSVTGRASFFTGPTSTTCALPVASAGSG